MLGPINSGARGPLTGAAALIACDGQGRIGVERAERILERLSAARPASHPDRRRDGFRGGPGPGLTPEG
jgi:hypothetical protein